VSAIDDTIPIIIVLPCMEWVATAAVMEVPAATEDSAAMAVPMEAAMAQVPPDTIPPADMVNFR
jgi:hypothetical protein